MVKGERIFVDSAAFIALRNTTDINHKEAQNFLERIKQDRLVLVTTNFVFDEVYTYFCNYHHIAVEMGRLILNNPLIRYCRVSAEDEKKAWEIAQQYSDKTFSFTDCTSFAVMERLKIRYAFTFDDHFRQYEKVDITP